ncbi:hypothetical protein J8281_16265 [Aquimarina sp. U1-2]|uniref:hypothetical protein n=1 Tax=Aquimarina sp. U1-2 TaxID=2823141 RepID=UPI001AECCE68|nr:hypothetical protein [Aquimarina sp. U1-2]MBP2833751.1 hypothetical protein [Aquimarina sp. U1-2]
MEFILCILIFDLIIKHLNKMNKFLITIVVLLCISCNSDDDGSNANPEAEVVAQLQGTWISSETTVFPIADPDSPFAQAYLDEFFVFDGETNRIRSTAYADEALTQPILVYESVGPFTILRESDLYEETWEADFGNTSQTLELLTSDPEILNVFGFENCGITETGIVYNINEGCSIFPGIDDCIERDIIQVSNGRLRFGVRTEDICEVRVTVLQDKFYTKQ